MAIGEKIREFAKKNYGTIKNFADVVGMSPENLSQYIHNKRDPGAPFLRKIHKLGCDLNWLLSDEIIMVVKDKDAPYNKPETITLKKADYDKLIKENLLLKKKIKTIIKATSEAPTEITIEATT